jgi:hypothetical protein
LPNALQEYLRDPLLAGLYGEIRDAGKLMPISVDLSHACNIRCQGCYFFAEDMDRHRPVEESVFDSFVESERERGTNFVTVVGGEPTLALDRLKKLYDRFWINVATNGLIKIPYTGFERLPIGVSVWGDRATDRELRGGGHRDVFDHALANYRDDSRAFFYYTVAAGRASEIESVVGRCIDNGNPVLFNYYGDIGGAGGTLDHRHGFADVRREVDRAIERYPDRILTTSYFCDVVTRGRLYDQRWGWGVCTSISADHPINHERVANGLPYNAHFRAYNADFASTRRCCTGELRDCESCFDAWEHFSWVTLNLRKHLGSAREFANWLAVTYLFYAINRIVDFERCLEVLPELHERCGRAPWGVDLAGAA